MKQLELQQEREERELAALAADAGGPPSSSPLPAADSTAPVRSRSGNDLVTFGTVEEGEGSQRKKADYANAKSMPASRRHSGELKEDGTPVEGVRRKGREGEPMLNNFLFDDELDADLQSEFSSPFFFDVVRRWCEGIRQLTGFTLSCRLCLGRKVPPDEHGRRQVPDPHSPRLVPRNRSSLRVRSLVPPTNTMLFSSPLLPPLSTSLPSPKPPRPTATSPALPAQEPRNGPSSRVPPRRPAQASRSTPRPSLPRAAPTSSATGRSRRARRSSRSARPRVPVAVPELDSFLPRGVRCRLPLEGAALSSRRREDSRRWASRLGSPTVPSWEERVTSTPSQTSSPTCVPRCLCRRGQTLTCLFAVQHRQHCLRSRSHPGSLRRLRRTRPRRLRVRRICRRVWLHGR